MSEYSKEDFAKDFIRRTQFNLKQLEQGPYEVTQLINSTVGAHLYGSTPVRSSTH